MNKDCINCGESWDIYHIIHDENLIEEIKQLDCEDSSNIILNSHGFTIQELCGWHEVPEGHFLIRHCPACKN